jgi:hypothetical protein
MAKLDIDLPTGHALNQHITDVLNDIIISTKRQIDRDEKKIWDGFLHELSNEDWENMFAAFEDLLKTSPSLLTNYQSRKYEEARQIFNIDKHRRERCMDIRNKFMNTKEKAWSMIMVIREYYNATQNKNIPNVDTVEPSTKLAKDKYKKIEITVKIFEDLFEQHEQ